MMNEAELAAELARVRTYTHTQATHTGHVHACVHTRTRTHITDATHTGYVHACVYTRTRTHAVLSQ